jgi:hypothetical protein
MSGALLDSDTKSYLKEGKHHGGEKTGVETDLNGMKVEKSKATSLMIPSTMTLPGSNHSALLQSVMKSCSPGTIKEMGVAQQQMLHSRPTPNASEGQNPNTQPHTSIETQSELQGANNMTFSTPCQINTVKDGERKKTQSNSKSPIKARQVKDQANLYNGQVKEPEESLSQVVAALKKSITTDMALITDVTTLGPESDDEPVRLKHKSWSSTAKGSCTKTLIPLASSTLAPNRSLTAAAPKFTPGDWEEVPGRVRGSAPPGLHDDDAETEESKSPLFLPR